MKKRAGIVFGEIVLIAGLIWIDQLVKNWAYISLKEAASIPIIRGIFQLTYAQNIGAAFSILENAKWFFILTALIITAVILFSIIRIVSHPKFSMKDKSTAITLVLFAMIVAGALGNVIDRIMYGFVIDMFDFVLIHFPIFNVADSYIVVAVIILGILLIVKKDFLEHMEQLIRKEKPADDKS